MSTFAYFSAFFGSSASCLQQTETQQMNKRFIKTPKLKEVTNPSEVIKKFGGPEVWDLNHEKKVYFCKICTFTCEQGRRFLLRQHVDLVKHEKSLQLHGEGKKRKQQMLNMVESPRSQFAEDITKAFVSANIPLHKSEHPAVVELFKKYAKVSVPGNRTLTRVMENESTAILAKIKSAIGRSHCGRRDD